MTPQEHVALGRAARSQAPRSAHAGFVAPADRADPLALLERQATSRVPELVPIRYERMAASPFAFFRGAALVMAADLAGTPTSGLPVQACGDAHLSNFGLFASPERQLVFDINDFDETLPGPWEWDVKRLAASIEIAGRDLGFSTAERSAAVLAMMGEYRRAMAEFAGWTNLAVWYAYLPAESRFAEVRDGLDRTTAKRAASLMTKARTRDHLQAFTKLVRVVDGELRFVSDPPLLVPIEELYDPDVAAQLMDRVRGALAGYRFELVHVARKVVGVGSVGTRAWVVLMVGRDASDPLILQIKEAQASVLEEFAGPSAYDNHGQRVVAGQRAMQASGDILLGWQRFAGFDAVPRDFYVRQLRDWKGSVEVDQMRPAGMSAYGTLCAWTLARAHARSGDRIAIAAYLGGGPVFDRAIADFASGYADQNELDHAALVAKLGISKPQPL
jgi:uncharacterized protein (DUF2252 family)